MFHRPIKSRGNFSSPRKSTVDDGDDPEGDNDESITPEGNDNEDSSDDEIQDEDIDAFGDVPIQASGRGANNLPARPLAGHHWGGGNVLGAN